MVNQTHLLSSSRFSKRTCALSCLLSHFRFTFIKKGAYRRKAKRLRKRNVDMVKNYSSFKLTKRETSLIERGQGFVPRPKNVNVTGLVADCKTFTRKCAWKWWWAEFGDELDQTEELDGEATDVFPKPKKFNLPNTQIFNYFHISCPVRTCGHKAYKLCSQFPKMGNGGPSNTCEDAKGGVNCHSSH